MKKKSFLSFFYKKIIITMLISVVICSVATFIFNKEILINEMQSSVSRGLGLLARVDVSVFSNTQDDENEYERNYALSIINSAKKDCVIVKNNGSGEIVAPTETKAILRGGSEAKEALSCSISYFEGIDYKKDYIFMAKDYYINGNDFLPGNIEVYKFYENKGETKLIKTIDLTPAVTTGYTHIEEGIGVILFTLTDNYSEEILKEKLPKEYMLSQDISNAGVYYKKDKGFLKYDCYEYIYNTANVNTENRESYTLIYNYKIDVWNLGKIYFIPLYVGFVLVSIIISAFIALLDLKRYEKMRYQRTLTSSLAHDLKSPLMVISGSVENIVDNVNPEKNDKYIKGIGQNANHMNDIILNIMDLNELQSDTKVKIEKKDCDIKPIIDDLFATNKEIMAERNIKAIVTGSLVVKCNKNAFSRAIENIINNAILHSEEGKIIEVILDKKEIIIKNSYKKEITYTGKQLVEPFVKGDDSRGNSGTGLGLSIAKSIMDMHKFKMKINMENNVFEVRIQV